MPAVTHTQFPGGRMIACDMRSPEGRQAARSIMKALGTGDVMIPQTAAEKRADMVRVLGEDTVRLMELASPFRDGFRSINERFAQSTAEAVRTIAEGAVRAQHIIGKAA